MISSKHIAVLALAAVSGTGIAIFAILTRRCSSPKITVGEECVHNADESNKADDDHDDDMISKLPDDILIKIISLMRTKYAVRTSILSKRWTNLFKSSPTFRFNYNDEVYNSRLSRTLDCKAGTINLVHRFLHLRSDSHIEYFSLHCCVTESSQYEFQQIIDYLGRFGIKYLSLEVSCCKHTVPLPFSCDFLFKMPTLRYLDLKCGYLHPSLKESNNYLSLQTIKLTSLKGYRGGLESILSNCSKLQSLTIKDCKFLDSKLDICGPKLRLKTLVIRNCEYVRKIKLYASKLVTFHFESYQMVEFAFDYIPRLQHFHFKVTGGDVSVSYVCGTLARDLPPQLESLTFRSNGDFNQESVPMGFNMFGNLKQLKLIMACICRTDLLSLTRFLHGCPLLKELSLEYQSRVKKVEVSALHSALKKIEVAEFYSHLKKVEISGFWETMKELNLALYILKTAVVLEQMCINICARSYGTAECMCTGGVRTGQKSTKSKPCDRIERIHKELEGQAVSKTARLIIGL